MTAECLYRMEINLKSLTACLRIASFKAPSLLVLIQSIDCRHFLRKFRPVYPYCAKLLLHQVKTHKIMHHIEKETIMSSQFLGNDCDQNYFDECSMINEPTEPTHVAMH